MKLNPKVIVIAGLAMYATQWILSMGTGALIHNGILMEPYLATPEFWRPELTQVPPDMAALLPRWIATGVISTFILAAIYDNIRGALDGSGAIKGLKFGFIAWLFSATLSAGWSGIFNLPEIIWFWWGVEFLIMYLAGGAVLGLVTQKLSPEQS